MTVTWGTWRTPESASWHFWLQILQLSLLSHHRLDFKFPPITWNVSTTSNIMFKLRITRIRYSSSSYWSSTRFYYKYGAHLCLLEFYLQWWRCNDSLKSSATSHDRLASVKLPQAADLFGLRCISHIWHRRAHLPSTLCIKFLAKKGGNLDYDELVVYDNDAVRRSFMIMYEPLN